MTQGNIAKNLAAMGAFKLSWYIQKRGYVQLFERYPYVLTCDVSEEEITGLCEEPEQLGADCAPEEKARYRVLYEVCRRKPVALTGLELYLLCYMEPVTIQILKSIFGEVVQQVTVEIAARITYAEEDYLDLFEEMEEAYECLKQIIYMEKRPDSGFRQSFLMEDRLVSYLKGKNHMDRELQEICYTVMPSDTTSTMCVMEKEIQKTCIQMMPYTNSGMKVVQISGRRESGRRFAVRQIASRQRNTLLMVPLTWLLDRDGLDLEKWFKVTRELILTKQCLCIYDEKDRGEGATAELIAVYQIVEQLYASLNRPLYCTTGNKVKLLPFLKYPVYGFEIPKYSILDSICLWKEAMKEYELSEDELPVMELAGKMQLTAGQIFRVVRKISQDMDRAGRASEIYRICYQILDDGKYDNIKRISSGYTLDDMKIGKYQKETLRGICAQVTCRLKVLDQWGMREKYAYGRGITVLFYGLPGTGKTMGAHVLASMLGLEIYKVDLSQIADKYIGETEKRLEQVFQRAENSNMILFFDEADALLGKRGEVKDARDKYANAEVSFLLQRMEEYDGIVIMATNLATNIDKAFMRRFRFTVHFPMPDREMRKEIWKSLLGAGNIPKGFIDLDYLAEQFEISGAAIKNIVWNALFRAASADEALDMKHLVSAVHEEHRKMGKIWSKGDYGEYYYLVEDLGELS